MGIYMHTRSYFVKPLYLAQINQRFNFHQINLDIHVITFVNVSFLDSTNTKMIFFLYIVLYDYYIFSTQQEDISALSLHVRKL